MKITTLATTIYQCDDEEEMRDFVVSQIGDRIVLYGSVGNQMFSYDGDFTKEALIEAFPDYESVRKAALLHTRGILNKERLCKSALEMHKNGIFNLIMLQKLQDLIKSCNCAPSRVIEKLVTNGVDFSIIQELRIYEESPEMTETVRAFMDFLKSV